MHFVGHKIQSRSGNWLPTPGSASLDIAQSLSVPTSQSTHTKNTCGMPAAGGRAGLRSTQTLHGSGIRHTTLPRAWNKRGPTDHNKLIYGSDSARALIGRQVTHCLHNETMADSHCTWRREDSLNVLMAVIWPLLICQAIQNNNLNIRELARAASKQSWMTDSSMASKHSKVGYVNECMQQNTLAYVFNRMLPSLALM